MVRGTIAFCPARFSCKAGEMHVVNLAHNDASSGSWIDGVLGYLGPRTKNWEKGQRIMEIGNE